MGRRETAQRPIVMTKTINGTDVTQRIDYENCKSQGNIYELAANRGYIMESFSDLYLTSKFCNNGFDKIWSLYHSMAAEEALDELLIQIGKNVRNTNNTLYFDRDAAWWIGFTYRQLCIETGLTSREIQKIVPFNELCGCYAGLHTLDEEWASDMICEKHNLKKLEVAS